MKIHAQMKQFFEGPRIYRAPIIIFLITFSSFLYTLPTTPPQPPTTSPARYYIPPKVPKNIEEMRERYRRGKPACGFVLRAGGRKRVRDVGHVCVVIRSFVGQVKGEGTLARLYDCLEKLEYENWSSYVFYVDDHPVVEFEWVIGARDEKFKSKHHVIDTPYHKKWNCNGDCGYMATDWAIYNACPNNTRWLLTTNGDNEYAPTFLSHLDPQYDAIGFNWFSRQKGIPLNDSVVRPLCSEEWQKSCMKNGWNNGRNDLGSCVWNYPKFVSEHRNYSKFSPNCCHDGLLAHELIFNSNWNAKNVSECLFSHNPNPWSNCMKELNRTQT